MIRSLYNVREQVIEDYSDRLYYLICKGISNFGKVYIYAEPTYKGIKEIVDKEFIGINIEEKLWIFLNPLLKDAFHVETINPKASVFLIYFKPSL